MGIKCMTDGKPVKVIRKDGTSKSGNAYTLYSIMYSYKQNDEWKNVFLDCTFRKGVDIANKTKIEIKDAFMTGSEYNGNTKPKLFVTDYAVVEEGEQKADGDGFMNLVDGISEELPFC